MRQPGLMLFAVGAEINLHDLTVRQALTKFVEEYNAQVATGNFGPIAVIHGYRGGNRISTALRRFLSEHPDVVYFRPGEDFEDNPGTTRVFPIKCLPAHDDELADRLAEFCRAPKPLTRILSKFWQSDEHQVKAAIDVLIKRGELNTITKKGVKQYLTVTDEEQTE
jgi:hypothetical protein